MKEKNMSKATKSTSGKGIALLVLGGVFLFPQTLKAETECPHFPKVTFWGNLTHESVRLHIEENLGGDWDVYLRKLHKQNKTLTNIYDRGAGAIVKRRGRKIKLSGNQLAKYIKFDKSRIAVVQCLAELEDATKFAGFSTAAGTPSDAPEKEASKFPPPVKTELSRTYLKIPESLLAKLRKLAVQKSLRETRKATVSEIVVDILNKELKNRDR